MISRKPENIMGKHKERCKSLSFSGERDILSSGDERILGVYLGREVQKMSKRTQCTLKMYLYHF